jgi:hypothetical protein
MLLLYGCLQLACDAAVLFGLWRSIFCRCCDVGVRGRARAQGGAERIGGRLSVSRKCQRRNLRTPKRSRHEKQPKQLLSQHHTGTSTAATTIRQPPLSLRGPSNKTARALLYPVQQLFTIDRDRTDFATRALLMLTQYTVSSKAI